MWFKGHSQPVKKEEVEQMFSTLRGTIRNQVWEKAGIYLNEDIIIPLCDKWACTAHELKKLKLLGEDSEEYSKLLADAQNILSENFIAPDYDDGCDGEVIARQVEDVSYSSNLEMYVATVTTYPVHRVSAKVFHQCMLILSL